MLNWSPNYKLNSFADFATIDQTATEIKRVFEKEGYPLDPHTAVGSFVARQYQLKTGDLTPDDRRFYC